MGETFKLYFLWIQEQKRVGVIAASAGNHALALAYHGSNLEIPVTVVMPIIAPMMKINLCRQYGANVIVHGDDIGVVSNTNYIFSPEYEMWCLYIKKLFSSNTAI